MLCASLCAMGWGVPGAAPQSVGGMGLGSPPPCPLSRGGGEGVSSHSHPLTMQCWGGGRVGPPPNPPYFHTEPLSLLSVPLFYTSFVSPPPQQDGHISLGAPKCPPPPQQHRSTSGSGWNRHCRDGAVGGGSSFLPPPPVLQGCPPPTEGRSILGGWGGVALSCIGAVSPWGPSAAGGGEKQSEVMARPSSSPPTMEG